LIFSEITVLNKSVTFSL